MFLFVSIKANLAREIKTRFHSPFRFQLTQLQRQVFSRQLCALRRLIAEAPDIGRRDCTHVEYAFRG